MSGQGTAEAASPGRQRRPLGGDGEAGAGGGYFRRFIRLDVSSRFPPMACTSA